MTFTSSPPAWLRAAGLPRTWRGQSAWQVLDTNFGTGERLLALWQAWTQDPHACHLLHVVAFAERPAPWSEVLRSIGRDPDATGLARELEPQWFGLLPGFHRLVLQGGRMHLTLCIGPTLALLREQQFHADCTIVGPAAVHDHGLGPAANDASTEPDDFRHTPAPWNPWALKALARLCRRGSLLVVLPGAGLDPALLVAAGWKPLEPARASATVAGPWTCVYQPSWQIRTTRSRRPLAPATVSRCIVVGAGLAGAGVAGALALRGWQVTVLDAAPEPAAGASGLPVGLFAAQLSRDDDLRSRLSRAGVRATLQVAHRLLRRGQDWDLSGMARIDTTTDALPRDWPEQARTWAAAALPVVPGHAGLALLARPDQALWQATAGWIKPAQLVRAWLALPPVDFQGNSPVQDIRIEAGQWRLFGPGGRLLAEADQLVLAAAGGSQALLRLALAAMGQPVPATPLPLTPVDGQVSWALHHTPDGALFPRFPVNGAGSVAAHIPWSGAAAWFAGATYEAAGDGPAAAVARAHAHNRARLAQLLPDAAASVSTAFAEGAVRAWRGTRWTLADRLPIAGGWPLAGPQPAMPGLWLSTAMGSRGLTYAALCGELIAAQLGAEPLPLDLRLQRRIDVQRIVAARQDTPTTG